MASGCLGLWRVDEDDRGAGPFSFRSLVLSLGLLDIDFAVDLKILDEWIERKAETSSLAFGASFSGLKMLEAIVALLVGCGAMHGISVFCLGPRLLLYDLIIPDA